MNARVSFLSAAILSFALCAPAGAVTVELFHETFDGNDQNWSYTSTGARSYDKTWTEADTVKPGYKGIKLGSTTATGAITSESFSISNTAADVSIVVIAAAYQNNGGGKEGIAVTVYDSTDTQIYAGGVEELTQHSSTANDEIPTTTTFTHEFTVPAASLPSSGGIYMKIESTYTKTGQRRALLGDVLVTQTYSTGFQKLATPVLTDISTNYTGFVFSWNPIAYATNDYVVTLSPAGGSVSVSGTTATVTGLEEGSTYTASIMAKGDGTGTDDSDATTLTVTTLIAPPVSEPDLTYAVSASSLTVSWPTQNDADFSVRAWTNAPANSASENFLEYAQTKTVPDGWIFENTRDPFDYTASGYTQNPVDFKASGNWIATPEFGGIVSSVTFRFRSTAKFTGSFTVYGTTGSTSRADWVQIQSWEKSDEQISVSTQTLSDLEANGFTRLVFAFEKSAGSGNIAFGSFSVTGTGVGKEPVYLPGYGSAPTAVAGTSVTFADPVVGETYCVEVTATGLSGRTATSTLAVPVSRRRPAVIAVK